MHHAKPLRVEAASVSKLTEKGRGRCVVPASTIRPSKSFDLANAYPGEQVQVLVGQRRNAWLLRVLEPHAGRREAVCSHFGSCGGCTFLNLQYATQLELKWQPIFNRLFSISPNSQYHQPVGSPRELHYRTKLEFTFAPDAAGKTEIGFHWTGRFDRVVDLQTCYLSPAVQSALLRTTREWAKAQGLSAYHPRRHEGELRYLVLRHSSCSTQWLATLVTSPAVQPEQIQDWVERVSALGPVGLIWARQESSAGAVKPDSEELVFGQPKIEEYLGDLRFEVGWRSFYQANPLAYRLLLDQAREWGGLTAGKRLIDLFCGVGTVGLYLQNGLDGLRLTGVEEVEPAVLDARSAASANGKTADFHCSLAQDWSDFDCDLLVLDPPRSGCHPKLIQSLVETGPQKILYISCNPEAFARELSVLSSSYQMTQVQAFDFFPQTRHIELLAELVRK